MLAISSLKKNKNNPRLIKDAQLVESLREFPKMLALRPLIVDEKGMVLGGNMRLEALKKLGYTEIPAEWVRKATELTVEEQRRFIIEDNLPFGEWDYELLLSDYQAPELIEWGFEEQDLPYGSNFDPQSSDDQGKLDQKSPITCPHCGEQFTP